MDYKIPMLVTTSVIAVGLLIGILVTVAQQHKGACFTTTTLNNSLQAHYKLVSVHHSNTFTHLVFSLENNSSFSDQLQNLQNTLQKLSKKVVPNNYPFKVKLLFGLNKTNTITFHRCFDSSILLAEIIKQNIDLAVSGAYISLRFIKLI